VNQLVAKHSDSSPAQMSLVAQLSFGAVDDNCIWIVHWAAAAAYYEGEVFIANSLGDTISPVVAQQLKQLFAGQVNSDGTLALNNVCCTQQPNGSDCGFFAAEFIFE